MQRVCIIHRSTPVTTTHPSEFKYSETLTCPKCNTTIQFWHVATDGGIIVGVAGQNCGGFIAMSPEEWADIPDQIRGAIEEARQEGLKLKRVKSLEANQTKISELEELLNIVGDEWEDQ